MNILIAEYFTGGGLCGESPRIASVELYREGSLMLRALARDLSAIDGVCLLTTRDERLVPSFAGVDACGIEVYSVRRGEYWEPLLRDLLDESDAFWPIAPETGGALARLCELCERSGKLLLNSSSAAVRCAASKRLTVLALAKAGLPCIETWDATEAWFDRVGDGAMVVCKPDDGVGCDGVCIASAALMRGRVREGDVVQPYVEGKAVSLSVLYGPDEHRLAAINVQEVECSNGSFSLKACVVNGLRRGLCGAYDFDVMAKLIKQAIPGLAAYVGVDCIVRDGDVRIVEVNPRLTDSYAGLHRSLDVNPAACVISLLMRSPAPHLDLESAKAIRVEP